MVHDHALDHVKVQFVINVLIRIKLLNVQSNQCTTIGQNEFIISIKYVHSMCIT